jgi:transposase InsO family protein
MEMPSDNGSPYAAKDTRIFARQLGLKPWFTQIKDAQSNGISEAFIRTLKYNYV